MRSAACITCSFLAPAAELRGGQCRACRGRPLAYSPVPAHPVNPPLVAGAPHRSAMRRFVARLAEIST